LKDAGVDPTKLALDERTINETALEIAFAAYRQAQQHISTEAAAWLALQLRPTLHYFGAHLSVAEAQSHLARDVGDYFNNTITKKGRAD
jgi:hypothetical protein